MPESLRYVVVLCLGLSLLPGMSRAMTCEALDQIDAMAVSNFAQTPAAPDDDAQCDVSQDLSGRRSFNCAWEHDFRAQAAQDRFAALNDAITHCFGADVNVRRDPGVNHPDFYDLRQYDQGAMMISVSLKDKGALRKTYVFLRYERHPAAAE